MCKLGFYLHTLPKWAIGLSVVGSLSSVFLAAYL
jgi:hypothetical protein